MSPTPWVLVRRHLLVHWARSGLTATAMTVALFLFCTLISIVTSLDRVVKESAANRLIVQSAVSLFVSLPLNYQAKIAAVPGVEYLSKFQWFGGIYKDPGNFFAQFGVDPEVFLEQYRRDLRIVEGPPGAASEPAAAVQAAFLADRRAAVIGRGLAERFGWKVGDTVPLLGTIFQKADRSAWEFNVVGIYEPLKSNVDNMTMFFRFDYLDENLAAGTANGPRGVGTFAVNLAPGAEPARVIAAIDGLFAASEQRTQTVTEAAFQAQFASMMGNIPMFLGTIGGAVVFAVFFSLVNTMLMAARQRVQEVGILKALGFTDGALARLLVGESLALSLLGGGAGVALAWVAAIGLRDAIGTMVPNYAVEPSTVALGLAAAAGIGLVAAIGPALQLARLRPTEALRSEG